MDFIIKGLIEAIHLIITADKATFSAVTATLKVSSGSMVLSFIIGLPAGFMLGFCDFPYKHQARLIVDTLLSLPTVFVGLIVYSFLAKNAPLGQFKLLFTLNGIILGQALLAIPIVISLSATAIESMDEHLRDTLMSLGASRTQIIGSVLWEVRYGIIAAALTAYGRVMTEVGISMMVGGNIKWHTRTITTAIVLETSRGMFSTGIALGLILIIIAFTVNITISLFRRK